MSTKKILSAIAFVISTAAITSCEENGINLKQGNTSTSASSAKSASRNGDRILNYTFDGSEGGAIPVATALGWTQNYLNRSQQSVKSHFFGAAMIKKILSATNCMGIRIYYALDEKGNKQLLLIGADNNGNDIQPASGIKGKESALSMNAINTTDAFTITDGDDVPALTSKQWISDYGAKNPNSLIAHFFGHEIINQILNQNNCIGIRMYYALNDAGVQQILLVGVDNKGQNILLFQNGRETDGGTVGDMSFPCPTYCGG